MPLLYFYTGRNAGGKAVRGSIEAESQASALAALRVRALFVTSLEAASGARGAAAAAAQIGPVPAKHLIVFFRCFATLIAGGVPMRRALDVTVEQTGSTRLREALEAIASDIENGLPLSAALARRPREFPRMAVALVTAGEAGGSLDEGLSRLATLLERERALRKRIAAALAYPSVVACAACGVLTFLLVSIVPMFRATYEQLHVPLPPVTAALIALAQILRSPLLWIGAIAAAAVTAAALVRPIASGRLRAADILAHVPVARGVLHKVCAARFSRTVGTLLRSGVGFIAAIDAAAQTIAVSRYLNTFEDIRGALAEGCPIHEPLARSGLFEPMFVQMVRAGEETGTLDAMLLRLADFYDLEVETALGALAALIEPALILTVGAAVGFIVSSIFIPLYSLAGAVK